MASIKKNFAYQSIYQVTAIILPLVTSPYIARVLGAGNIGIYSYTYAIAYYFMLFALLGISNHGNRMIAAVRDDYDKLCTVFSELMVVHCAAGFLAVAAYYLYVMWFAHEDTVIFIIQGLWVLSSFFDVSWFFFGMEKFQITVIQSTGIKILMTICIFLFVKNTDDLWVYVLIMAGGTFLSQVALWPFMRKYVRFRKVTWTGIVKQIKPMLLLFVPCIAVSIYKYMDKIMLGNMTTKTDVGLYENAERAINIPISIINSFGVVMLPRMSNLLANGNKEKGKQYIGMSMEMVMCLAVAMAFGMAGVAENFSVLFWGKEFLLSGKVIQLLSVSMIFWAFANILRTQYLIPKGKNNVFVWSVCLGAIINLIINYLTIPRFSSMGAAIGTIFAEATVCIVQAIAVRKELPIDQYAKKMIPFIFIGAGMYIVVYGIDYLFANRLEALMVQICVGGLFYCGISYIYFKKEKNMFVLNTVQGIMKKILRRK